MIKFEKTYIFWLVLLAFCPLFFLSQNYHWSRSIGGKVSDGGIAITTDKSGNVYSIGYFTDTVDFDPGVGVSNLVQTSQISGDMYILKLDSVGRYVWAKRVGGTGPIFPESITVDNSKNVYVTGEFYDVIDFNPDPTVTNNVSDLWGDCFILKLDSLGNYKWSKFIGGPGSACFGKSIVAFNDKIYLGGSFKSSSSINPPTDFDPSSAVASLTSSATQNPFIAKYDTAGNFIWVKGFVEPAGSLAGGYVLALTTNSLGDVYSTGYFRNSGPNYYLDFDPGIGTYTMVGGIGGYYDVFTAKLDVNGDFVWAKNFVGDGTYDNSPKGICLDDQQNVYTMGYFQNTIDLDPTPSTTVTNASAGSSDIFVSKLDVNGNFVWSKTIGGAGQEYASGMVSDTAGNLCLTGFASTGCDFDPGPGTNSINCIGQDGFISTLDQNGNLLWVKILNSQTANSYAAGRGLVMDRMKNVYVTGEYLNSADLNPDLENNTQISKNGNSDVFILKLGGCGIPLDVSPSTTICVNQCTTLTASSAGSYSWTGGPNTSEYTICPTSTTIYSVSGTISSNCIRSNSVLVTVDLCTGISEDNLNDLKVRVYPNPVKDKLKIETSFSSIKSITLSNVLGKVMYESEKSETEFDLSNYASGVYFLNLKVDDRNRVFKIIKE